DSETAQQLRIDMQISIPFKPYVVSAGGKVAWVHRTFSSSSDKPNYHIGVEYDSVNPKHAAVIMGFARKRRLIPHLVGIFILLMCLVVASLLYYQNELIQQNKELVGSMVRNAQSRESWLNELDTSASQERELIAAKQEALQKIEAFNAKIDALAPDDERLNALEKERDQWVLKESQILNQLSDARKKKASAGQRLQDAQSNMSEENNRIAKQLYAWLSRHANKKTGLVPSFEGDQELAYIAYTYDQALVSLAHTIMGDTVQAAKILHTYQTKAQKVKGGFVSGYDSISVVPVEWNVHVGPNVWIGIAAVQYQRRTNDRQFQPMAEDLGGWLIDLQKKDPEGGLSGGPDFEWFSTEHNLDAYSYFKMLYEITGDRKYDIAAETSFRWVMDHAADRSQGRFKRGRGDATIATDTFSWSIAAIGPERLASVDFSPEGIMEFAEEHCRVTVPFKRPEGETVNITGFDFSKPENIPRGGVVSSEWTAQAVVTYQILEKYFRRIGAGDKSDYYRTKAIFYLSELQKMIISSLSKTGQGRGCLPYATSAKARTGHGWRTPQGHQTGSVAGTAYSLFAWKSFNPFE
ncbi:MAG: hypothetical protein KC649_00495, partial [Candidatus Omnitrophica bacterium]|nr:hypothetical protein [Candidatus Omnitrophota bacterium]